MMPSAPWPPRGSFRTCYAPALGLCACVNIQYHYSAITTGRQHTPTDSATMPGRPAGSRSTRTSTASTTRKSSSGVNKSTRASSTRQSAHAIEIPDEGSVTALRTQIAQVFSDAQKTTATQRKLAVHLRKIQEACCFESPETGKKGGNKSRQELQENFDEEDFNNEIWRCILRLLNVKKSEAAGDRVIRFLGLFLKHASDKGGLPAAST